MYLIFVLGITQKLASAFLKFLGISGDVLKNKKITGFYMDANIVFRCRKNEKGFLNRRHNFLNYTRSYILTYDKCFSLAKAQAH